MTNRERKLKLKQLRRKVRSRAKMHGTAERPRLHVFRSLKHINAQLIDDASGKTLMSAHSTELDSKGNKQEQAAVLGKTIASRAKEKGITHVVFDRSGYKYHGRVKALAEAARKEGLVF